MAPDYKGSRMDSMFTARDPKYHQHLKSSVARLFSMSNMRNFEIYADECTAIFVDAMRGFDGQAVDFAVWLQWYAFDVIGSITFQHRFGFMEQRRDVDNMIAGIDQGLQYIKVIGQYPEWFPVLKGLLLQTPLKYLIRLTDTMDKFMKVRGCINLCLRNLIIDTNRSPRGR